MPFVLHAAWLRTEKPFPNGHLFLWADGSNHPLWVDTLVATEADSAQSPAFRIRHTKVLSHPGQISAGQLRSHLLATFPTLETNRSALHSTTVWLPSQASTALPSQQQKEVPSVTAETAAVAAISSINRSISILGGVAGNRGDTLSPLQHYAFLAISIIAMNLSKSRVLTAKTLCKKRIVRCFPHCVLPQICSFGVMLPNMYCNCSLDSIMYQPSFPKVLPSSMPIGSPFLLIH